LKETLPLPQTIVMMGKASRNRLLMMPASPPEMKIQDIILLFLGGGASVWQIILRLKTCRP
jgi:hypothetical protein